jgi:hypothetical protein
VTGNDDDEDANDTDTSPLEERTVLLPELMSWRKPRSVLDTGLEENTVLGRTRDVSPPCVRRPAKVLAAVDGDSIGSSSPSAVSMLRRFSSRLGSLSGMMVPGLATADAQPPLTTKGLGADTGGCMGDAEGKMRWEGRKPVVRTERRVDCVAVVQGCVVEATRTAARGLAFPL